MSNERTKNTKLHTRRKRSLSLQLEQLETRAMLAASPCHNETQPADINADGFVSPIDALSVINLLNAEHTHCGVANGQFADVNNDSIVSPIDVLLVVNTLSLQAEGEGNALISLRLQVENFDRTPLQNIAVGEEFFLSVYVQDVSGREPADSGVYAAYLDIDFDANLASVVGPITYGEDYENGQRGTVSPGLIDEAGAFDGGQPLGIEETLLLSVPMVSDGNGNLEFSASSADILPAHDSLLFGFDDAIPLDQIMYGSVALNVGGVPPVANDDSYQAFFGDVLTVETQRGVLANDTDPNGEDLVAELVVGPDLGELTLNKDGSFVYTPFSGVIGTDTFSYQAVTGDGRRSEPATVFITIDDIVPPPDEFNQPPIAAADSFTIDEDAEFINLAGVLENDSDPDQDTLRGRIVTEPSNGTLHHGDNADFGFDGTLNYTPNADFFGVDSFTYVANDGILDSNIATVTIEVQPVPDPPVAIPDDYRISNNRLFVVDVHSGVLANDYDVDSDSDSLNAKLQNGTQFGALDLLGDGSFTYAPEPGFEGEDTFTYVASDGSLESEPTEVTIFVSDPVVVPPQIEVRLEVVQFGVPVSTVLANSTFTVNAYVRDKGDAPRLGVEAAYMDLLYNDDLVGVAGPITFNQFFYSSNQSGSTDQAGIVNEVGATASISLDSDEEFFLFSVPFTASDLGGTATFSANGPEDLPENAFRLQGELEPVPNSLVEFNSFDLAIVGRPIGIDDQYETGKNIPVSGNVTDNDSGESLVATLILPPSHGFLSPFDSTGSFTYFPDQGFEGTDVFSYLISNSAGSSETATVTLKVVDNPPVAVDDFYAIGDAGPIVNLDVPASAGVLANDFDPNGDDLLPFLVSQPSAGNVVLNSDGSFTYTSIDFFQSDSFEYMVQAGDLESEIASVTLSSESSSDITGHAFVDRDVDGNFDAGEIGLELVQVSLSGTTIEGEIISLVTSTALDGSYRFENIPTGAYRVVVFLPIGFDPTTTQSVDIEPGLRTPIDFGFGRIVSIGGQKFNDRNANGRLDFGEPGLADWLIDITVDGPFGKRTSLQTRTDDNGFYSLMNVGPGQITVKEVARADWTQTVPSASGGYVFDSADGSRFDLNFGSYLAYFTGVVAGSLDGNGNLIVVNDYSNPLTRESSLERLTFVESQSSSPSANGVISARKTISLPEDAKPQAVFVADLNNNGTEDIAVASIGATNGILLFEGTGSGFAPAGRALTCSTFQQAPVLDRCDGPIDVVGGNFRQGSGAIDFLATANFRSNTVSIIRRGSSGFSNPRSVQHIPVGNQPIAVEVGQFNDDNFTDIAVANHASNSVFILAGDGHGGFIHSETIFGINSPTFLLAEDLNGDSLEDLAVTNYGSNEISVFIKNSDATYSETRYPTGRKPQSIAAGDLNGDSITDIAVANSASQDITVLLGDGFSKFSRTASFGLPPIPVITSAAGQSPQTIYIGDFDKQGLNDIAVAHFFGGVSIHLNGVDDQSDFNFFSAPAVDRAIVELTEDVNGDGVVTPVDALLVINRLNNNSSDEPVGRFDVNRDQFVSSLDALRVINRLNEGREDEPA